MDRPIGQHEGASEKRPGVSRLVNWMDERFYPGYGHNWDTEQFREYLLKRLKPGCHALDYGAGRGSDGHLDLRDMVGMMAGVDPDRSVFENEFLDEAKLLALPGCEIPYHEGSFDVVFSNSVMEHVASPLDSFREVYRVLKPKGQFIFKTPNLRHYMPMISRLTPHSFHVYINELRGRPGRDTFPTYYKCNTPEAVRRYARDAGFEKVKIDLWEGRPEYMRIAVPMYIMGFVYERIVNLRPFLRGFRVVMVCRLEKPSAQ